ncbi:MAG: hypothetical protein R3C60_14575 [Parvularculaceae bacterium]
MFISAILAAPSVIAYAPPSNEDACCGNFLSRLPKSCRRHAYKTYGEYPDFVRASIAAS